MDDLVKQLRDRGVCSLAHNSCRNDTVCEQAADRIEALEARITKLEVVLQGMIGGKVYVAGHGFVETNESRAARTALKEKDT